MAGRRPGPVGQRLHNAPAHTVRPERQAPDEADDDEARPPSPCHARWPACPVRDRNADLNTSGTLPRATSGAPLISSPPYSGEHASYAVEFRGAGGAIYRALDRIISRLVWLWAHGVSVSTRAI